MLIRITAEQMITPRSFIVDSEMLSLSLSLSLSLVCALGEITRSINQYSKHTYTGARSGKSCFPNWTAAGASNCSAVPGSPAMFGIVTINGISSKWAVKERERERERGREQIPQDFARRSRAHTLGHVHLQARFKDNHSPHYIRILRVRARGAAAATLFPQLRQFVYTVGDPCGFSRRARVPIGLPNWRPLCHANSERGGESERACIERREIAQQALCPPPPPPPPPSLLFLFAAQVQRRETLLAPMLPPSSTFLLLLPAGVFYTCNTAREIFTALP